ncbi:hypothetical protein [Paenibacillus ginsengihumi]|uniref:hypothetical protein n=1 Tax=Paenibacillus ginsengihumi TaxID=431596 RepID=UPI0003799FA8|nr:hypothetical protein [Paenibacillus ginsengihumi]
MDDPKDEGICPQCGFRLVQRKEAFDCFDPEDREAMDCPGCRHLKSFAPPYWE